MARVSLLVLEMEMELDIQGTQVPLELVASIRSCAASDLRELEWFGSLRAHRPMIEQAYRRQLEGTNWMLIADVRGFPVGQLWVDVARAPDAGLLWAFRIMPPFQGLRLGTALLEAAERELARHGICNAEISVEPWNQRALSFYRRVGFELVADQETSFETMDDTGTRAAHALSVLLLRKRVLGEDASSAVLR